MPKIYSSFVFSFNRSFFLATSYFLFFAEISILNMESRESLWMVNVWQSFWNKILWIVHRKVSEVETLRIRSIIAGVKTRKLVQICKQVATRLLSSRYQDVLCCTVKIPTCLYIPLFFWIIRIAIPVFEKNTGILSDILCLYRIDLI
jgi:hypothetical protein